MATGDDDWRALLAQAQQQLSQGVDRLQQSAAVASGDPRALAAALPVELQLALAFAAGLGLGLALPRLRAPFRRFATVDDIPGGYFHQERRLRAVSVGVSDGDTFRARHLPLLRGVGQFDGKKSDNTLQIRLAGIDTPETAKFGSPGQPFGEEAKAWLAKTLDGRPLTLTLLHKDQYARAVCMVEYGRWPFRRDASEEILKAGLAYVYRQAGAVYGGKQETFEKLEAQAKKRKLGIWSQKEADRESAAEYKARVRASKQ